MAKSIKNEKREQLTLEQLAQLLRIDSTHVKLSLGSDGWALSGKSINDYRALKRLITKGDN
jgi:RNA:NAD 2'-phosphotransferase (TPT1/KptA family)